MIESPLDSLTLVSGGLCWYSSGGGSGTPHSILNGLGQRVRGREPVAVFTRAADSFLVGRRD